MLFLQSDPKSCVIWHSHTITLRRWSNKAHIGSRAIQKWIDCCEKQPTEMFMFNLRPDPAGSHRDLPVDGGSWLHHRGRLGVDGRLSVQIHSLECRFIWDWKLWVTSGKQHQTARFVFPAGNPDDYFGEDCLSILINDGYWNDDNCQNKRGYICKRRGEECCLKCCWWWITTRSKES